MDANHVEIRHLTNQDMAELREASEQVYESGPLLTWTKERVDTLLTKFPDGLSWLAAECQIMSNMPKHSVQNSLLKK